ncbi:MAG: peptidylprolyl isomerase, partial [Candidatus Omnitrophica bacterium]|nr:peptidylprolyl isomerase [Candidatus Omnitrophota bacterium]
MKRSLTIAFFLSVIFSSGYAEENKLFSQRIIAVVNEELITQTELEQKKSFLKYQIKQTGKDNFTKEEDKELETALLQRLIVNKLVREEAKKENITVSEEEIRERIDNVKKRFPNEDAFRASLKEAGLNIEDLHEAFEYELILQKLFFDKWRKKIIVSPREIEEFYKMHREEFREPEQVRLRNIFVYKQGRSDEEITQRLEEILNALRENMPFEEVARKYSEGVTAYKGGIMGEIKRGELSPRIEKEIFSLKPGELSQWIETESGFYLFKLDEYLPGKILEFS